MLCQLVGVSSYFIIYQMAGLTVKSNPEVEQVFSNYPDSVRDKMQRLRKLVLETAEETPEIRQLEETLKWGVPSYQTVSPKSGTPIRLQWLPSSDRYGIFVHCQTTLIKPFSEHHPELTYDKNRGILFEHNQVFPEAVIKNFLSKALRYRLRPYTA